MKVEVGMYVRTKKGIAKIVKKFDKDNEPYDKAKYKTDTFLEIYYDSEYIGDADIIGEPSHNIIKLLQVGDVIATNNLCGQVTCIEGDKIYTTCYDGECCYDYQIQSIVTKEQFESMSYKVGE